MIRSYRYRIYPTDEQQARLLRWEGALRALWNAALEQRFYCLDRKIPTPGRFEQQRQLTDLRAEESWMADVPRHVADAMLGRLDASWRRYFAHTTSRPRWKKRGRDNPSLSEMHPGKFCLSQGTLRFPKIGAIPAIIHRPLVGAPRTCTITRNVDQWFVSVVCEQQDAAPPPRSGPVVALDRGVTNLLADSEGQVVVNPAHLEAALLRLAHAQRVVSRRVRGSRRCDRARVQVAKLHRTISRQRSHFLHVLSNHYAKSHGVVVIEKLNVQGMARSRLARQIYGASWSAFGRMLRYKLEAVGGTLVEVPAAYSSQTCSACGAINAANRHGESFSCLTCGHQAHADTNAALILLSRRGVGETGRGGLADVTQPTKRQTEAYISEDRIP